MTSRRDHRDVVIEQMADDIFTITTERDGWRLVAVSAIHHSHQLYLETQRESVIRLRDENRQLRESLMLEPTAV